MFIAVVIIIYMMFYALYSIHIKPNAMTFVSGLSVYFRLPDIKESNTATDERSVSTFM
jgi:hypothetical protein